MHHTDMNVRMKLGHFLIALGENIGTIGNTNTIIRKLKDEWPACDNEDLRAAQARIITDIIDVCIVILTENQKSNHAISRYDPLARVDRMRMLAEIKRRNQKQTYMFKEEEDAKRFVRVSTGRPFESYHRIGKRCGLAGVSAPCEGSDAAFVFE